MAEARGCSKALSTVARRPYKHIFRCWSGFPGAPLLGAAETIKASLSGITFGLPISESTARLMCNSFSSSLWLLPFSGHSNVGDKHCQCSSKQRHSSAVFEVEDDQTKSPSWPVDIVNFEIPAISSPAYPSIVPGSDLLTNPDCSGPYHRSFSAREIADGTFFHEIENQGPEGEKALHQLNKFYLQDPVLNPLTPWERPPLRNVFCIYGIDMKTEVGYHYAPSGKPYPDNWILSDVIYEMEGGKLQSRSGSTVEGNPGPAGGDATVPYHSLSWCKNWLGPLVNITRTPQHAYSMSDVQEVLNVDHDHGGEIIPNMTRDSHAKYITFYEDGTGIPGRRTAVWEIDKVDHRNIVRLLSFLRELWLETSHGFHPDARRHFVSKAKREPIRDEDCYWDYAKARCGMPEYCEYRYVFGDVHLGQSCRLKASSQNPFQNYL